jgi:UDP-2,3-diacylglucosamine hydrolase
MSILIISDLHLDETRPEITALFLRFLNEKAKNSEALYILGDFFEAWVGDDNLTEYNLMIMNALREVTQKGLPVFFMPGNRDFLIGKTFLKATGCQLLPDEYVVSLHGVPTLMMHGDTLCSGDIKYQKFRKKSRYWLMQKIFLMKSLNTRRGLIKKYREASQAHISTLPDHIMDVTQAEVERVMQKHGVQLLVHGHTHREAVHEFELNNKSVSRTVLGAWHDYGSVLVCQNDAKNHLEHYK